MRVSRLRRLRVDVVRAWVVLLVALALLAWLAWRGAAIVAADPAKTHHDHKHEVEPGGVPSWDRVDPILGSADRVEGNEVLVSTKKKSATDKQLYVAFTFDDGPSESTTPLVIDALEKYNIPAAFFIVTQRLAGKYGIPRRDVLAREAKNYIIGAHSITHSNLVKLPAEKARHEIDQSLKTLTEILDRPVGLFRPPFGAFTYGLEAHLRRLKVTDVRWEVDTKDFRQPNAEKLRTKVSKMILKSNGGVVLMHDIKPSTSKAITGILDDLEKENCRRLATNETTIIPVSIQYFLRDDGVPRAIPAEVAARTQAYREALPGRCAHREDPAAKSSPGGSTSAVDNHTVPH